MKSESLKLNPSIPLKHHTAQRENAIKNMESI